ncbi:DCC1-like thiol-disulfide oxidoreductase family protein [Fulvivirga sp. M361]|uniref:DCC1-like thiol-disulfide oxidoreductase family protein n=1 Tax=Fulvivirga sp. M361 TaxID=2594266 RepID=UPI001C8711A6|nr:DCC1-like thiol-disulfide oxidoreductase family protein [Fulvivirga sp. M361]
MKDLLLKIEKFWFDPAPANRLAILRISTGGFSLWYLLTRFDMMKKISRSDLSMFEPVGLANIFSEPLPPAVFTLILAVGVGLCISYTLGWKYKWTGPLFALFLLFILSYRNSWTMIYHSRIALVLHVFIIGLVSAADSLSLDAMSKKKKVQPHWRYGWPIKLICAGTVVTYFLSGLAKLFGELAWDWVSGDAMRSQVAVDAIRKEIFGETTSPLFEWIYPNTGLFLILGIGTFIIELGAPLVLFNKRAGMIWAFLTWSMHWGIFFIMGISFRYQQSGLIFLSFFDVEKSITPLKNIFRSNSDRTTIDASEPVRPAIVLFDGVCNFCDSTVRFVIKNDNKNHFQFASIQSLEGQKLLNQYHAPSDNSTIVLIEDSKVFTKSSAVLRIARQLKGPWYWLYPLIGLPKPFRDAAYRVFAKHRYQWFGIKDTCEIPDARMKAKFL